MCEVSCQQYGIPGKILLAYLLLISFTFSLVNELDPKGYRNVNSEYYVEDCYISLLISRATSIKAKPKFVKV